VKVHRFRHTFATWAIENEARELDVQYLLGHSTPAMVRRYSATYDAEKAARAHERFSPADRLNGCLRTCQLSPGAAVEDPNSAPIFESKGLTIRPLLWGDLVPSNQVVAGSIPVSRSTPHLHVTTRARQGPSKGRSPASGARSSRS
jgi:hypothetical protein